jgi:hypothetical protein
MRDGSLRGLGAFGSGSWVYAAHIRPLLRRSALRNSGSLRLFAESVTTLNSKLRW